MRWKASGENDGDDAEEDIPEEELEQSSDNASGYVGVYAHRDVWQAKCRIGGQYRHIGSFAR